MIGAVIGIVIQSCGGPDCNEDGCELSCRRSASQFERGFSSELSCGTGALTVAGSNHDMYSRPTTFSYEYANGRSYACNVQYDTLGSVVDLSCEGECDVCND